MLRHPSGSFLRIALVVTIVAGSATRSARAESLVVTTDLAFPAGSQLQYDAVTVEAGATLTLGGGTVLTIDGPFAIAAGALVLCESRDVAAQVDDAWAGTGVRIAAQSVTIATGGRLSADGQGYVNGAGPGGAQGHGYGTGASHGGRGTGPNVAAIYGDTLSPDTPGSAGGFEGNATTAGGGAIHLVVTGTLTLDGEISANGAAAGTYHGGAAGGSLWIEAATITGTGSVRAQGAAGSNSPGAGGGGRLVLAYDDADSFVLPGASAVSGAGTAQAGSLLHLDRSVPNLQVHARAYNTFPQDSVLHFGTLTLDEAAVVELGGGSTLHVDGLLDITGNSSLVAGGKNTTAQVDDAWAGAGVYVRAGDVTIDAGSTLSADGQGYGTAAGPGAPAVPTDYNSGASHGGRAGGTQAVGTYGSAMQPVDLGSGGGYYSGERTTGGGAIHLVVDRTLLLDGEITADGTASGTWHAGASGGSLWVETTTLIGTGRFTADGCSGSASQAQSAGGRIAVYYADGAGFSGFVDSTVEPGAPAGYSSERGTLLFMDTSTNGGHLRVTDRLQLPELSTLVLASLTIDDGGMLEVGGGSHIEVRGDLVLSDAARLVTRGRNLSAPVNGSWAGQGVTLIANNLTVGAGCVISADGAGYTTGAGPGAPSNAFDYNAGASHGGLGNGAAGVRYGDPYEPTTPGSGGGIYGGEHTAGGGALRIQVSGTLTLDGEITADGAGSGTWHAGGAGGSIWVETDVLAGSGFFSVEGGRGSNSAADSGGGRLAVYFADGSAFTGFATTAASAGRAQSGTTLFVDTSVPGGRIHIPVRFSVDEEAVESFGSLSLYPSGILELGGGSSLRTTGLLDLGANAIVHAYGRHRTGRVAGRWEGRGVHLQAGDLSIATGALLTADGQGYATGAGPGASPNSYPYTGGSHGGLAGGPSPAETYGSADYPAEFGSPGGIDLGATTHGGGTIRIDVAGTLQLDGEISADGWASGVIHSGASGGSIWINTGHIRGSGLLTADGTEGSNSPHGSGGGRIAVHAWGSDTLGADQIRVAAGRLGAVGTIVRRSTPGLSFVRPQRTYLRGLEPIVAVPTALNPATTRIDAVATGGGREWTIGSAVVPGAALQWDTRTAPDGAYVVRAVARNLAGTALAETSHACFVLNDVSWHSGILTGEHVWGTDRVHVVDGILTIGAGATLTIQPGAVVKFLPGSGLHVADGGTLNVLSTAEQPCILTSITDDSASGDTNRDGGASTSVAGSWDGITSASGATVNVDTGAHIRYLLQQRAGGLTVAGHLWLANQVHYVTDDIYVPSGATLTILPGAIVKFAAKKTLRVAAGARLVAEGSLATPIIFTSDRDDSVGGDTNRDGNSTTSEAGDWRALHIEGEAVFNHARLRFGGGTASGQWDGTGMLITYGGNAQLTFAHSTIEDSFFDGMLLWGGSAAIINSLVVRADRGILAHPGSTVAVSNCTVDDCREGLVAHSGNLTVTNTIVSHYTASGIQDDFATLGAVSHTNVWSPVGGALAYRNTTDRTGTSGNISADPKYRHRTAGDFSLSPGSPAIDAADTDAAPGNDFMGVARYDDPATVNTGAGGGPADMGAFEFVDSATSPRDLTVTTVSGPSTVTAGATALIHWTVRNVGSSDVLGPWRDVVSLAPEADLAAAGTPAAEVAVAANLRLAPGQSAQFTASVTVPNGVEGRYRWVVEANGRGDIFEGSSRANNRGRAIATTALAVPELVVGSTTNGTFLQAGRSVLFKVRPAAGQDVVLTLDREGTGGWSRLAVAEERLPRLTDADAISAGWNQPDATVSIARASGAVYYIAAIPSDLPTSSMEFVLGAEVAGFTAQAIGTTAGALGNRVTVPVVGSGMQTDVAISLAGPAGEIAAAEIDLESPNRAWATFDLTGAASGDHDVVVRQQGLERTLPSAFRVVSGTPGQLRVAVLMPTTVRAGRDFTAWIDYENVGLGDLTLPVIGVTSPDHVLLKGPDTGGFTGSELAILAIPAEGPPWILAPGQKGRVAVQFRAVSGTNRLETHVATRESPDPMPWDLVGERLSIDPAPMGWNAAWAATTAWYGPTAGDYVRWLEDATRLRYQRTGARDHNPERAMRFYLQDRIDAAAARSEGYVHIGTLDRPAAGVLVSLIDYAGAPAAVAVAARDGLVRLSAPIGTYTPEFEGYLPPASLSPLTIPSDGPPVSATWILREAGSIRGEVVVGDSVDKDKLAVVAQAADGTPYPAVLDTLGRYHIAGLPAGTYHVRLLGEGATGQSHGEVAVVPGQSATGPTFSAVGAGVLQGTVTRAADGAPLANVSIVASAPGRRPASGMTGADGTYVLRGVEPGEYSVSARIARYVPARTPGVLVQSGQSSRADFALGSGATIRGRITSSGTDVAGAIVSIRSAETVVSIEPTNDRGEYAIHAVPPGTWTLSVESGIHARFMQSITVAHGDELTVDAALTETARVTHEVTRDGASVRGVPLRLTGPDGLVSLVFSGSDGTVAFGRLAPGAYVVSLLDGSQRQTFTITDDTSRPGLTFALQGGALRGRVTAADGVTPLAATVTLVRDGQAVISRQVSSAGEYLFLDLAPGSYDVHFANLDVFLAPLQNVQVASGSTTHAQPPTVGSGTLTVQVARNGGPVTSGGLVFLEKAEAALGMHGTRMARIANDGTAVFTGLAPGEYRLQSIVSGAASNYVSLTAGPGATSATVDVVAVGTLRGFVRDDSGRALGGVFVSAFQGGDPDRMWQTTTAPDGSYALTILPAGAYSVVFGERSLETQGTRRTPLVRSSVTIAAGASTALSATVEAATPGISGHIGAADGSVPLSALVEVHDSSGRLMTSAMMHTDGSYTLPHLPAGDYRISAKALHFTVAPRSYTAVAGVTTSSFDLVATWVGGAGTTADVTPYASRSSQPTLQSIDIPTFDIFNDTWLETWINAVAKVVRETFGEPPFAEANLPRPEGLFDPDCPAPAAVAAYQSYLTLQKNADVSWEAWKDIWESNNDIVWGQVGLFGMNLLKFAVSLISSVDKLDDMLSFAQDAQPLLWDVHKRLQSQVPVDANALRLVSDQLVLAQRLVEDIRSLKGFKDLSGGLIPSSVGGGFAGNLDALFDMFSQPWETLESAASLEGAMRTINDLVGNLGGIAQTSLGVVNIFKDYKFADGPLSKRLERLGKITDGISAAIEGGRAVYDFLNLLHAVHEAEEQYQWVLQKAHREYQRALRLLTLARQNCCPNKPGCDDKPPPPAPPGRKGASGSSNGVGSVDPNEKLTSGLGTQGYITAGSPVVYTIKFENLPTASAPAQVVTVTDPLPTELDWSTLELVSLGFNGVDLPAPTPGLQAWSTRTEVTSDPNPVDVSFTLDPATGLVTLLLNSIDPVTGVLPEDPLAGFLPPNDVTGRGEGYVTFLVYPKSGLADGTQFENTAEIVFDANEPIVTNTVVNTIDRSAPTSTVDALAAVSGRHFTVSWSGTDAGSGITHYDLYVSTDGGTFTLLRGGLTTTSLEFTGAVGHTYAFWVRAYDALGQTVVFAATPQATTRAAVSRLGNISTRGLNGAGAEAMIVGFVVNGGTGGSTPLILRGVGPRLGELGLDPAVVLADPSLDLYDSRGAVLQSNDDWDSAPNAATLASESARLGAFRLSAGSHDSALLTSLAPGIYTARMSGSAGTTGIGLIELYDTQGANSSTAQMINLSTRGWVGLGDQVLIAGFAIIGEVPKPVLIRGVGPTLGRAPFNVPGALQDPVLTLFDRDRIAIVQNDSWETTDAALIRTTGSRVGAFTLPTGSHDAAILITLRPGTYTAIVNGAAETTGVALVEVYDAEP